MALIHWVKALFGQRPEDDYFNFVSSMFELKGRVPEGWESYYEDEDPWFDCYDYLEGEILGLPAEIIIHYYTLSAGYFLPYLDETFKILKKGRWHEEFSSSGNFRVSSYETAQPSFIKGVLLPLYERHVFLIKDNQVIQIYMRTNLNAATEMRRIGDEFYQSILPIDEYEEVGRPSSETQLEKVEV